MNLPKTLNLPNPDDPSEIPDITKISVKKYLRKLNDQLQKEHRQIYDCLADHEKRIKALEP